MGGINFVPLCTTFFNLKFKVMSSKNYIVDMDILQDIMTIAKKFNLPSEIYQSSGLDIMNDYIIIILRKKIMGKNWGKIGEKLGLNFLFFKSLS